MIQEKKILYKLPDGLPPQPTWEYRDVDWNAYDVPRMWDMVRHEDDALGWEQIQGFKQLSELIDSHVAALERQREQLWQAWPPESTPAAVTLLKALDQHISALKSDSLAAATSSHGLNGIMVSLSTAKREMQPLAEEWFNHTSHVARPGPWWSHVADRLNREARSIMGKSDADVNSYRSRLIVPQIVQSPVRDKRTTIKSGEGGPEAGTGFGPGTGGPNFRPARPIPPVPGFPPLQGSGPDLQGLPAGVPAVPGQPVSMLPIAPGNPYVPGGGAYILPGPGVGRGGYVVPMPTASTAATGYGTNAGGRLGPNGSSGMMPMPVGGAPAPGRGSGGQGGYRRQGETTWPVRQGVPPVIMPEAKLQQHGVEQDDTSAAFQEWYTELAMPWRLEGDDGPAPTVTIRRGVEDR
ncbi:hypothetical protein Cs7R123_58050 [Catellatospora sp. TT07R-123]|uniref:hypothetical protein n=1 Tax=Catellatospora sp. TT07R-123 TaxID=2733863 RepID=UPI001B07206A|nr:hypothetical protein [Catellatospora sp. TT07R-123]GHJ48463.1 hypothetical protein Cs7R123_58050 [Catellatospora sp. TT07R-123]